MLYRRIYLQGNSLVTSLPMYVLREMDVGVGDYALLWPVGPGTMKGEFVKKEAVHEVWRSRCDQLRLVTARRLQKQGNSVVITIPRYFLEKIDARKGDYFAISVTGEREAVFIVRKSALHEFEQQKGFNMYRHPQ